MATREIISLVCDLHGGKEVAGAAPAWLGIDGQLYQLDVCPECAARLSEVTGQFITHARRVGVIPEWLPRPDIPAGRTVTGPTPKRDLILSVIRARIADGTYPAGSYLPSQRDLADEHGMSVTPVISACWELEGDGFICGTARGRYIIEPAAPQRTSHCGNEAACHDPGAGASREAGPGVEERKEGNLRGD